jgi:anti-sigma factor ChrR (cupin superfamily)
MTMLCAHCNGKLDPSDHNCCEACDLQDQLRARVAELESLVGKALVSHDSQAETITRLTDGLAMIRDLRDSEESRIARIYLHP